MRTIALAFAVLALLVVPAGVAQTTTGTDTAMTTTDTAMTSTTDTATTTYASETVSDTATTTETRTTPVDYDDDNDFPWGLLGLLGLLGLMKRPRQPEVVRTEVRTGTTTPHSDVRTGSDIGRGPGGTTRP